MLASIGQALLGSTALSLSTYGRTDELTKINSPCYVTLQLSNAHTRVTRFPQSDLNTHQTGQRYARPTAPSTIGA